MDRGAARARHGPRPRSRARTTWGSRSRRTRGGSTCSRTAPARASRGFFDIEWHPVKDELADKVLIPILGDQYGAVLERQELQLAYRDGAFLVRHYDDVLPIAPDTFGEVLGLNLPAWLTADAGGGRRDEAEELQSIITSSGNLPPRSTRDPDQIAVRAREKEIVKRRLAALVERSSEVRALVESTVAVFNGVAGEPRSFDRLDRLLNAQSYRLAHWRVASEEINYRRFFDVNQLAALRMEDPVVFDEVHRFVFELVERGAATGLRIDHVDGLFAPGDYLRRLQERCRRATRTGPTTPSSSSSRRFSAPASSCRRLAGARHDRLRVRRRREQPVRRPPQRARARRHLQAVRPRAPRAPLVRRSRLPQQEAGAARDDVGRHQLARASAEPLLRAQPALPRLHALQPDLDAEGSHRLLPGLSHLRDRPDEPVSDHDRRYIVEAVRGAKRRAPAVTSVVFDFIERLLLKQTPMSTRRRMRGARAVHRQVSADHEPGRRQRASRTRRSTSTTGSSR